MEDANWQAFCDAVSNPAEGICNNCRANKIDTAYVTCDTFTYTDQCFWPEFDKAKNILDRRNCAFCHLFSVILRGHAEEAELRTRYCVIDKSVDEDTRSVFLAPRASYKLSGYDDESELNDNIRTRLSWPDRISIYDIRESGLRPDRSKLPLTGLRPTYMLIKRYFRGSQGGVVLPSTAFDVSRAKTWLANCQKFHGPICYPTDPRAENRPTYVVDVNRKCVVNTPPHVEWFALSYTWGPLPFLNTTELEGLDMSAAGSLSRLDLPRTIEDAIQVTANLGERYLWIDVLCIKQGDEFIEEKIAELRKMRSIFADAKLTLVSLDGKDANSGLAGIRPGSRCIKQAFAKVEDAIIMTRLPSLESVLKEAHWETRGWTYQESVLCKRYLYFSQTQVYFRCEYATWNEDAEEYLPPGTAKSFDDAVKRGIIPKFQKLPAVVVSSRGEKFTEDIMLDSDRAVDLSDLYAKYRRDNSLDQRVKSFDTVVGSYTKRRLTYSNDVLEAVSGVIDLFTSSYGGYSLCGLLTICFHLGLWWDFENVQSDEPGVEVGLTGKSKSCQLGIIARRRTVKGFHMSTFPAISMTPAIQMPSWSWAGWEGPVRSGMDLWGDCIENLQCVTNIYCAYSESSSKWSPVHPKCKERGFFNGGFGLFTSKKEDALPEVPRGRGLHTILLAFWSESAALRDIQNEYLGSFRVLDSDGNLHAWEVETEHAADEVILLSRSFSGYAMTLLVKRDGPVFRRMGTMQVTWENWKKCKGRRQCFILA